MAKNLAAVVAHHRNIVEMHDHAPQRAPLESVQIVLLAGIHDALVGKVGTKPKSVQKAPKPK